MAKWRIEKEGGGGCKDKKWSGVSCIKTSIFLTSRLVIYFQSRKELSLYIQLSFLGLGDTTCPAWSYIT